MDPSLGVTAIKTVLAAKKALDTAALRKKVDEIEVTVESIGLHLAGNALAEIRAGYSHLEIVMSSAGAELRVAELGYARQIFNRVAARSGADLLLEKHSGLSADQLSALGHFGNYHYFLLLGEPERSLIAAYRATELFPSFGALGLPAEIFSRDYRREVPGLSETREQLATTFQARLDEHEVERRSYRLDMAWRIPAAVGAVIAGLAGSFAMPSMAGRGIQWATGILSTSEKGLVPPTSPSWQPYRARAADAERAWQPVVHEARARRIALEQALESPPGSSAP